MRGCSYMGLGQSIPCVWRGLDYVSFGYFNQTYLHSIYLVPVGAYLLPSFAMSINWLKSRQTSCEKTLLFRVV